ncbi:hypothetical protein [Rhodocyclus tenuis]|uniref:hypothetical protein n=1 Tax=Rhodocyclus tenuis TaxID=1066 RepID=UPI0019075827|nr:hypothetical protein [Rhodocyclus tenuis]
MTTSRDEYTRKIKLQLDDLNVKIDELESKVAGAKAEARDKYKAEVSNLRLQYRQALAKLDELKASGEESWGGMVAEVEKVRDAFVHSFNYFRSQL